jgi:hypothetical protein
LWKIKSETCNTSKEPGTILQGNYFLLLKVLNLWVTETSSQDGVVFTNQKGGSNEGKSILPSSKQRTSFQKYLPLFEFLLKTSPSLKLNNNRYMKATFASLSFPSIFHLSSVLFSFFNFFSSAYIPFFCI